MSVTLQHVADQAGVSASTVSRVLNQKGAANRISEATMTAVMDAARELGYAPNRLARGLRLQKTYTVGLIAPDVSNPFFAHIVHRAQNTAHELGYSLVVCNSNDSTDLEVEQTDLLYQKQVDGLIAMPVGQCYDHFEAWTDRGGALVLVDRCPEETDADTVSVDNYRGAYGATTHLVDHGHRRIALVQGLPGTSTNSDRLRGYADALADRGVAADPQLVVGGDFRRERAFVETKTLLTLDPAPTAIFAAGDLITLGVLQALAEEELRVPEDVSLLSFDDFDFAPFLRCPLTAVRQPRETMGETAVKLLADRIRNPSRAPRRVVLESELVVRRSVAIQ